MVDIKDVVEQLCYTGIQYSKRYSPFTFSPFGAILVVILLSYMLRVFAQILMVTAGEPASNTNTREYIPKKGSMAGRAIAAHFNGLETTIGFAAAVFAALSADYPERKLEDLCTLYVLLRFLFTGYYILFSGIHESLSYIRTAIFLMGQGVTLFIFLEAAEKKFGYIYLSRKL